MNRRQWLQQSAITAPAIGLPFLFNGRATVAADAPETKNLPPLKITDAIRFSLRKAPSPRRYDHQTFMQIDTAHGEV